MTVTHDSDRLLRAFLAEGATVLPERAYAGMRAGIHKVGQDGAPRRPWARLDRSSRRTWLAAVAAVGVVAVVGATLLPRALVDRSDPAATAIAPASLAPPSSPQPSASPAGEAVGPGPVTLEINGVQATLTLPEGWHVDPYRAAVDGGPIYDPKSPPLVDPREAPTVELWTVETIWRQPCINRYDYGRANTSTARALASQISEAGSFETSGLRQVDVGGHSGWAMDLTVPQQPADCAGPYAMWGGSDGMQTTSTGDHHEILVLDVAGRMIVVDALDRPESSAADRSALRSIVESIQFDRILSGPTSTTTPFERVEAGPASLEAGGVRATMTAPAGWSRFAGPMAKAGIFRGAIAELAPKIRMWTIEGVFDGPCQDRLTYASDAGLTADELVARLRDSPFLSREPDEVIAGGFPGWALELVVPSTVEACPRGAARKLWVGGGHVEHALPGEHHRLLILDVEGGRVVVDAQDFTTTSPEARLELKSMLESIVFERFEAAIDPLPLTTETDHLGVEVEGVRLIFTVPAGWRVTDADEAGSGPPKLVKGRLAPSSAPQIRLFAITTDIRIWPEPCRMPLLRRMTGRWHAETVALKLEAAKGYEQSTPTDIRLGGHAGKEMELRIPTDLSQCYERATSTLLLWSTDNGTAQADPGEHHRLLMVDVNNVTLIIDALDRPQHTDEDRAELEAIMDSLTFD